MVLEGDRAGSGSGEPADVPVVLESELVAGNQEVARVDDRPVVDDFGADEQPLGVFAARCEGPEPAEAIAAVGLPFCSASWCDHGRNQGVGIFAVGLVLGLGREVRQHPGVGVRHARHPSGRSASLGERGDDIEVCAHRHLKAAVALGLQHLQQSLLAEVGDGLGEQPAVRVRRRSPTVQDRNERPRPLHQLLSSG